MTDDVKPLPADMTAIEIVRPGGPEVLVPTTRPVPSPGPDEVLIRIHAAGVNGPDVFQRKGLYDPPPGISAQTSRSSTATRISSTRSSASPTARAST